MLSIEYELGLALLLLSSVLGLSCGGIGDSDDDKEDEEPSCLNPRPEFCMVDINKNDSHTIINYLSYIKV